MIMMQSKGCIFHCFFAMSLLVLLSLEMLPMRHLRRLFLCFMGLMCLFQKMATSTFMEANAAFVLKWHEKIVSLFYGVDVLVPENGNFNFYGSQCCICIEMAFGMMSQKWGILKHPLSGDMQFTPTIAICVAHLHNFTINERLKK